MMRRFAICSVITLTLAVAPLSHASVTSEAVESTSKLIARQFSKEVVKEMGEEGAQLLTKRLAVFAAKYGEDEALLAARKVGPRIFRIVEEAGEEAAPTVLRLSARMGEESLPILTRRGAIKLVEKYGDDAARVMLKHKEIGETLVEQLGPAGIQALKSVDGQGARRLAMLADDGTLAAVAQKDALLSTIGKYGDGAMNWVWRNKGALATTAVVTAFIANPQPFIDGTVKVAQTATEHVLEPVASTVAQSVAQKTNWTMILGMTISGGTLLGLFRMWKKDRRARTT